MTEIADGFYEHMPFDQYAAIDALNGSKLIHLRRSPMKYRHELDNPTPPTPAMLLGVATHQLILEPERIGDFAVWGTLPEEKVRNGKVWENFKAANAGMRIITVSERDAMVGMAVGARKNLPIMKYANGKGRTEVSMIWTDPGTGRRFKGRLDKIMDARDTICDLKTTRSSNSRQFGAQAYALGYHVKMAIYWRGYKTLTGREPHEKLLAIESKPPHESTVFRVTTDVILQGMEELDALLALLGECERTDHWPAAHEDETDLILPAWAITSEQDSLEEFAEA